MRYAKNASADAGALSYAIPGKGGARKITRPKQARKRPLPAVTISTGRGLIVQAAVLMVLAAATNGAGIWLTPIFSEGLVLCIALVFLKRNRKQFSAS